MGRAGAMKGMLGSTSIGGRLAIAGAFLGAGLGASAVIQNQADLKRAYYGKQRYDSYYGGGADILSGAAVLGGAWYGTMGLLGRDPISRLKGTYNWWLGGGRAKAAHPFTPTAQKNKLKFTPRFNVFSIAPLGVFLTGGTDPTILAGAAGAAAVLGLARLGIKTKNIARRFGATAQGTLGGLGVSTAIAGAGFAGGAVVATRYSNPAAESSNILSFDAGVRESVTQRLNYSTAGLTLALHNMNRKQIL